MEDTLRCYKILDLEPGASAERVRRSYVELSHVWDPARYVDNPVLRERAEKKRLEIDEAYESLSSFLPELQSVGSGGETNTTPERDFTELSTGSTADPSSKLLAVVVGAALVLLFAWALYLVVEGRHVTPSSDTVPSPIE